MTLDFLNDATNVILVGPNGVGKSTLGAKHRPPGPHPRSHRAVHQRRSDCSAISPHSTAIPPCAGACATTPARTLLVIDEVGYLSYSNRHADLLFELITRRYENKSTLVTTNRRSPNGARSFPTPPASSPSSIASSTTPRSSPSRANPIASRKPTNAPSRRHANAAGPNHDAASFQAGPAIPAPLNIPAYWTPEQAFAVFELLDDLRERIMAHYDVQLIDLYREQQRSGAIEQPDAADDDLPF